MTIDYDELAAAYDCRYGWWKFGELESAVAGHVERIERRIVEAEARGETLRLAAELHFYATSGTEPR